MADAETTSNGAPPPTTSASTVALVTVWGARLAWLVVAVVGGRAVGDALSDHDLGAARALTTGAWIGWGTGALALVVPAVATLTTARVVVPSAIAVTVATAFGGADGAAIVALGAPAAVATVLVLAAEVGRAWVQASAYGDEQRFPLRPPLGYLAASVVSWAAWVAAMVVAAVALSATSWVIGILAAAVALGGLAVLPRRWHQLSRRWFVTVPVGVVVHDPVVLGETLMVPRAKVTDMRLVRVGPDRTGEAADLTGPTAAVAVEIRLADAATVLFAPRPGLPKGRAIHALAFVVAPSRPGSVLAEARRRRLPVS